MGRIYDLFMSKYNYIDFHELNLDWLIAAVEQFEYEMDNFVSINAVKYADPIQWNITKQYEKNTIVIDPVSGTAYISAKPVPAGVALSRTDYWNVVFDLSRFITLAAQNFANTYEALPTTTATMATDEGSWVVWDSTLYVAKNDIHVGDMYVPDGNIEKKTVEDFFGMLASALNQEIQDRQDADIQIMLDVNDLIASEAHIRSDEDIRIYQELSDLITSDVNLIDSKIGDLDNLTTTNKSDIVSALNEVNGGVKYCNDRSEVSGVNALENGYILSANAYQNDGIISLYKVTTGAADGYLNIAMDNDLTAELIHGNVIHAHQVGAFPNGSDCVSAINAIIDNVSDVTIKFGIGRYTFTDRLWLNSNQSIEGVSAEETTLYINQDPIDQHGEFIGIIGESGTVKENITLKDFSIDIYYLPSSTEDVNAIGVVSAKNILIERVNVLRSNWRGFQFEGEAGGVLENVIVRDCTINDCYLNGIGLSHGVGGRLSNILFENINIINSNSNAGFWIQGPVGANTANMTNVVLNNITYKGGTTRALYITYADNITVNGLTASDISPTLYAVVQVQTSKFIRLNDVSVICDSNNTNNWPVMLYEGTNINISGLNTRSATIGVQIQNDCDNVTVANSMINTRTGGTPIRNQVSTLKGYISGCLYNNAISNASTDFIELS